jgi:methylase of polypeptide subunit release factors
LYAASLGYRVRACDINPYAVASTRENAKRLNLEVEVHEGGPGPNEDGSVAQWAGKKPHDLIVWNLPYLDEEHVQGDVLGPMEEAALVDTDQKGLVSRLMAQVKKNSLLTNQGMILLLVGGNSKGSNAENEAQRHGFAARCVATHSFEDGETLRIIALWTPYTSSKIHQHDVVDSTNQLALDTGEQEGDLFPSTPTKCWAWTQRANMVKRR